MQVTIAKLLSLAIAVVYAVWLLVDQGGFSETTVKGCAVLWLPLALIWFPEELGGATGYFWRGSYVNAESPPVLLSIMGWFFLVGLPVLFYLLS